MIILLSCLGSFAAGIAVGMLIFAYKMWKLYTIFDESCVENNEIMLDKQHLIWYNTDVVERLGNLNYSFSL